CEQLTTVRQLWPTCRPRKVSVFRSWKRLRRVFLLLQPTHHLFPKWGETRFFTPIPVTIWPSRMHSGESGTMDTCDARLWNAVTGALSSSLGMLLRRQRLRPITTPSKANRLQDGDGTL